MHLMLLLVTLARAAQLPFCTQDLSDHPLPFSSGRHIEPDHLRERALRPGLMRLREDLCRCLPLWPRNQPALVKAHLHVDPNGGEMRVEYIVKPPWSRPVRQMMKCMGEPTLTFEPIHYVSDIVYPDGREEVFPHYPVWVDLENDRVRKGRSQHRE